MLSDKIDKGGRFVIEIDGKLDEENSFLIDTNEKWYPQKKIIRIDKSIKLTWNSNSSHLFIGSPILTPVNQKKESPNIILIVVDAMRYDALSQNGNKFLTTPNLDSLAKDSIEFTQAFANANWTKPSMLSMFYSEYASNLGLGNTGFEVTPSQKKIFYSSPYQGIINFLREKKYHTMSIMNNVFLLDYTGIGVDIGFHELVQIGKDNDDTKKITEESIQFLERDFQNPFFLHINYNTPHGPYTPPNEYLESLKSSANIDAWKKENPIIKRYLAEVHFADQQIGIIIEKLKERNLYDNTIIAITSDHGELFSDHHTISVNGVNGVKYGHGVTHYEEEIHLPFILKPHSKLKEKLIRKRIDTQFSLISLFPSILGLSNIPYENFKFRGKDFSKYILGEEEIQEEFIYTEGRLSESIRKNKYKYIRRYPFYSSSELTGRVLMGKELEEIYDLTVDPEEKINLITDSNLLKEYRKNLRENSLKLNSFHIFLPKTNSKYKGILNIRGGIYDAYSSNHTSIELMSRYSLSFQTNSFEDNQELIIKTIKPNLEFDLSLFKDNSPQNYRIGKWGLRAKIISSEDSKLVISKKRPEGIDTSNIPWIYNDEKLSIFKEDKMEQVMGEEVRQILKSWGYIHE
jgi:arylsulfatase A-like enzyme